MGMWQKFGGPASWKLRQVGGLFAAGMLLLGCSQGGSDAPPIPSEPDNACRKVPVCDIRAPTCQRNIFESTVCERGGSDVEMPPVTLVSQDEALSVLLEGSGKSPQGALLPTWYAALSAARMIGPLSEDSGTTTDDVLISNIAAFYVPPTKRVYVIDREEAPSTYTESMLVLSHEFVHAIQDDHLDLTNYRAERATTSDGFIALTALIEGEATVTSTLFLANAQGKRPASIAWSRFSNDMLDSILQDSGDSGVAFFSLLQGLPYPLGTEIMADAWKSDGIPGMLDLFEAPPDTLGSWPTPRTPAGNRTLRCYPGAPPPGFEAVDSDRLGPTGVAALTVTATGDVSASFLDDWLDDRAVLFTAEGDAPDTPRVAFAYRVRLADAQIARDLETSLSLIDPTAHVRVVRDDDEVLVVAADSADVVDAWDLSSCDGEADLVASSWSAEAASSTSAARLLHARQLQRLARATRTLPTLTEDVARPH